MTESGRVKIGSSRDPRLPRRVYRVAQTVDNLSLRILDLGMVAGAWALGTFMGYEANADAGGSAHVVWVVAVAIIVQLLGHRLAGLYGPVWRYASVDEAFRVVVGVVGGTFLATGWILVATNGIVDIAFPIITAPFISAFVSLLACGGVRFQSRIFALERQQARSASGLRTIIVGAGSQGASLAYELTHTDAGSEAEVLGFVDDDTNLTGRSVRGLPVLGTLEDIDHVCRTNDVERILITEPKGGRAAIKEIVDSALATKAQVKVLQPTSGRASRPLLQSLRDLDVTDLLGREHAPVNSQEIGQYVGGSRVLITGAGGSIGSEIARQVVGYGPAQVLLLDRDESLLHDVAVDELATAEPILADICDEVRMREVFERYRPQVVFHAAAQKHVPILERYPVEAVRTNVFGTWGLVSLAAEFAIDHFVHISTDKAADPCSVMGATKRAAEQIVFEVGRRYDLPFVAVRFGNVLGSRGSVVPTFVRQIVEGGPVTITSPEMTRYFMTIPEAVSLVLQSGAMADTSRIYLLDMGEPVPIMRLARQLIRLAGLRPESDIEIKVIGTRPGERLHERLHDDAERIEPSDHSSIASLSPKSTWEWAELVNTLTALRKSVNARDDLLVRDQLETMLRTGGVDCTLDPPPPSAAQPLNGMAAAPPPGAMIPPDGTGTDDRAASVALP